MKMSWARSDERRLLLLRLGRGICSRKQGSFRDAGMRHELECMGIQYRTRAIVGVARWE